MTDLAPYVDPTALERSFSEASLHRLAEWAQSADAAFTVAERLVRTSFVPEGFRGKPEEATAAILAGIEVGLSPMAALRSFDVIQGQAAARAITLRAIVQSHGHEIEMLESTDSRCRMRGRRRGAREWTSVLWTIDRARSLGLTNKHNWKAQPQAMLTARATSELARLIAADAILGIAYSAEEIDDGAGGGVPLQATVTATTDAAAVGAAPAPSSNGGKRMSRPRKQSAQPAPAADDGIEDAEVVDESRPSDAQKRKIMATFGDLGFGGEDRRADRIAVTSTLIGRSIESTSEVTRDEASRLIDQLERIVNDELVLNANDAGVWSVVAPSTGELELAQGDTDA